MARECGSCTRTIYSRRTRSKPKRRRVVAIYATIRLFPCFLDQNSVQLGRSAAKRSTQTRNNQTLYLSMGLTLGEPTETLISQGFQRKKNDENHLFVDKCALRDIGTLLNQAHIPWWVDCGTCLGAYRY